MKLNFWISRLANEFFFISTLSEWHYSGDKKSKDTWLEMTGPLSERESRALGDFKNLMLSKYGFQNPNSYLGEFFYKSNERNIWKALSRVIGDEDSIAIKNIFLIFSARFEKIWRKRDLSRVTVLREAFRQSGASDFFEKIAAIFGDAKSDHEPVTIVVLFSALDNDYPAAGSANLKGNYLTLEVPDLKAWSWQLDYSIAMTGHELGHLLFRKRGGEAMVRKALGRLRLKEKYAFFPFPTFNMLNEAIVSSFAPLGVAGQNYFPEKLSPLFLSSIPRGAAAGKNVRRKVSVSYYTNLEIYFIWKMLPLAMEYFKQRKNIDDDFVIGVGTVLAELMKPRKSIISSHLV